MIFKNLNKILGSPYYENECGVVYNLDCDTGLKLIKKSSILIDTTITSPPYNIGKEYEKILPIEEYIKFIVSISDHVSSITKPTGAYILNLGYLNMEDIGRAIPIAYLIWDKLDFYLQQEIIWNYEAGVATKKYLSPRNEKLLWYVKDKSNYTFNLDAIRDPNVKYPNSKKNGRLRCNTLGKNPSDVWQIAKVTSGLNRSSAERMPHPAQFPEDLITRAMLGFSNVGDIILDPFMGSGTTAKMAMLHNRKFIGFEINPTYCDLIKTRLETTLLQNNNLELFNNDKPEKPLATKAPYELLDVAM